MRDPPPACWNCGRIHGKTRKHCDPEDVKAQERWRRERMGTPTMFRQPPADTSGGKVKPR